MEKITFNYKSLILIIFLISQVTVFGQTPPVGSTQDTTKLAQRDSIPLKYPFTNLQKGGLFLSDPARTEIEYDPVLGKYMIVEKIGDMLIRRPLIMSRDEYMKQMEQKREADRKAWEERMKKMQQEREAARKAWEERVQTTPEYRPPF